MPDIITIGSATVDVFVQCDDANIVSVLSKDKSCNFMSYPYGAKIEINKFNSTVGGGGLNTATNFANLGFSTGSIFKIGKDVYADAVLNFFKDKNVDLSKIIQTEKVSTGFSVILVSFQGDRTVLAHRGGNGEIKLDDINLEELKSTKLLYLAPMNGNSWKILEPLADFAEMNNIKLCVNVGSSSLKRGLNYMKRILDDADIVVMNKEEASMATKIEVRPSTSERDFSKEIIHSDIKSMLEILKVKERQVVVITDGGNGAYAYDGKNYYFCPVYPTKVVSSLGAGDAFASTFCASMHKTNMEIGKSLLYASINSGAVVSKFGATDGLLTFDEIEDRLSKAIDFNYIKL